MKVIIAGSRTINSYIVVQDAIEKSGFDDMCCPWMGTDDCTCEGKVNGITEVVSGCARGVDALGEEWAYMNHRQLKLFPADWSNGPSAGHQRNARMAGYADALIAVWDGASKGTANMIAEAKKRGLKVFVYEV